MIKFYSEHCDEYGCFSNFSTHEIDLDGYLWKTSEHYFQAQKFIDKDNFDRVKNALTPGKAKFIGKTTNALRPDWEDIKDDIMKRVVLAKFTQHKDIRDVLLSTGDEEIVEDSPTDYYWGIGANGSGKNMLGKILMAVRDILRNEKPLEWEVEIRLKGEKVFGLYSDNNMFLVADPDIYTSMELSLKKSLNTVKNLISQIVDNSHES